MQIADDIKRILTMRQVAEHYGFPVGRSGFIKCPFHRGDRTASLKIYDGDGGWHCFGCNKGGSVIDFTMELFSINFRQAVLRLNSDFGLGLSDKRPDKQVRSKAMEQRLEEQRANEQKEAEFWYVISELRYWKEVETVFVPSIVNGEAYFHPLYAEAVEKIPRLEYWLDEHIERGDASWKVSRNTQKATT